LDLEGCKLSLNSQLIGECGPSALEGHQIVTIAQIAVPLDSGLNEFSMSLGDGVLMTNLVIDAIEDEDEATWTGDLDNLDLSLILSNGNLYEEFDTFESEISITNSGQEDISLEFTDTCRGETWVVDSAGRVVMDTLSLKECTELDVQNLLTPNSERTYPQPEWSFIDMSGCHVSSGDLTVIFEIPEHDLFGTDTINLDGGENSYCQDETVEIIAEISGDQNILVSPTIVSSEDFEINWFKGCGLETALFGPNGEINTVFSQCDYNNTVSMRFNQYELDSLSLQSVDLDDGDYYFSFRTITEPQIKSTLSFTWPLVDEQIETEQDDEDEVVEFTPRVVDGTWSATTNDFGICWLLNSPDEGIITLSGAAESLSWSPEVGATGQYLVTESVPSDECADFAAASFKVNEVYSQEILIVPEDSQEEAAAPPAEEEQESEISPVVITVGAVVASGGILSLLVALIATNESWRIPTTSAGLWLLALVGRTSETSDGRYQRGRLMGYLTANPGCHFRALMAALEMSNGQITHHLKVLEDEESIWRRPDGRLVRFYPYTSNLHPGIVEDELPLPPLSPDPNSLQGKILRLLDDDGNMKKYPTQAELAHRLDRSQQLVSHHLRTLQKFGLVQKQKMGVKNRYRLTREAVFLLDTTEV
jgi:DNA-binding MarR family transcriptional regulator